VLNTEAGLSMGRITLDWVQATFPYSDAIWGNLISSFGPVSRRKFGTNGYPNALTVLGSGAILWNDERPEMGIHLILPAQALALYEFQVSWLLDIIVNNQGKFTRIDLAIDDKDGRLDLNEIGRKLEEGEVQTRFKKFKPWLPETEIGQKIGQYSGFSVGSRQSESFIRIYDKRLESEKKGIVDLPDSWVRVELETKGGRAVALGERIIKELKAGTIGRFVPNLIWGLLDFKEPSRVDGNKSRWETSEWWAVFLGTLEKERITLPTFEKDIEHVKTWFSESVAPMACVILLNIMGDGQSGYDWLMETIAEGQKRFKLKHKKLIAGFQDGLVI
jgi:phage replication initiation protein